MSAPRTFLRPLASATALVGLTLGGLLVAVPSAQAGAPKAPTGLVPTTTVSTSTPTLSWKAVRGGQRYEVQADNSADFGSPEYTVNTVNTKAVPTTNLPEGVINWRVRATNKAGTKGAWATAKFTISNIAPPTPIAPANGGGLAQPSDPPLLTWGAVAGATGYEVEIDRDGNWIGQQAAVTAGTSYLVKDAQEIGSWSWRVRAQRGNGLVTKWSDAWTYVIQPLADVQADPSMSSGAPITDVALDWQPVAGAVRYQLQVALDPDFNQASIKDDREVVSTRFSPRVTYNNDDFYWRVRAIDAGNNKMAWPPTPFQFNRDWPNAPTLVYPADSTSVGDPFYFQWTPVRWATRYQLDVGTDLGFSPGTFTSCFTATTTFVPTANLGACGVPIGNVRYWRVRALDDPAGVQGIYSAKRTVDYNPGIVTQVSPVGGANVQVPTLTWNAAREAERYRVRYWNTASPGAVTAVHTSALSYTPTSVLPNGSYGWTVQSLDHDGDVSVLTAGAVFNVTGPPSPTFATPETTLPNTTTATRFPALTWQPVTGADYYKILIKRDFQSVYEYAGTSLTNGVYKYPAVTDTAEDHLTKGKWDWLVEAYNSSNVLIAASLDDGHFEITDLASVDGWSVALDGGANRAGRGCTLDIMVNVSNQCSGVPSTPVLSWAPVSNASYYLVYLSNDRELTNLVYSPQTTQNTMWVPPSQLPDNSAGTSYYWYIRPCKTDGKCNPDPVSVANSATNAFRKVSPTVQLVSPGNGSEQSDDVRFDWTDYYLTNQGTSYVGTGGQPGTAPSYQTANVYHLQVSQSPVFSSLVVDANIDQTTFTSVDPTLPEGTLYWRVQVYDANMNGLQWSPVWTLTKRSGQTSLISPINSAVVGGATPLRWAPKDFAAQYRVEVYSNDDPAFSPVNRVLQVVTRQPALSLSEFLKPSSTAYRWRVQAIDASGRDTAWSAAGRFFVATGVLTTTAPTGTGYLKPKTLYFAWNPVQLASSYRLEIRTSGGSNAVEVQTAATAYAMTDGIGDGKYEWRVTARDPNSGSLGQSAWKTFKIDQTVPVLGVPKAKAFDHGTKISLVAKFSEKVRGVSTKTVKLYKDGKKTSVKAKVTLKKGKKLEIVNKGKLHLRIGSVYLVKLASGIRDQAGNRLAKTIVTITVVPRRGLVAKTHVLRQ